MAEPAELNAIEVFVLCEVEPEAMLWEIPATWTNNGTNEQRAAAVPQLREAVVSLAERGLIDVRDFPAWPTVPHEAIPVTTHICGPFSPPCTSGCGTATTPAC
jgi:hypothetical protein